MIRQKRCGKINKDVIWEVDVMCNIEEEFDKQRMGTARILAVRTHAILSYQRLHSNLNFNLTLHSIWNALLWFNIRFALISNEVLQLILKESQAWCLERSVCECERICQKKRDAKKIKRWKKENRKKIKMWNEVRMWYTIFEWKCLGVV